MSGREEMRRARHELTWRAAQRLGEFTYDSLAQEAEASRSSVQSIVASWERQGVVTRGPHGRGRLIRFKVVADSPRPEWQRADGRARREETVQGNCWTAMRRLKEFTPTDIAANIHSERCPVSVDDARAYCQMLSRAGYLRVVRKAMPGKREAAYRLIRETGPLPPRERRVRAVWDDNLCDFTHLAGLQ